MTSSPEVLAAAVDAATDGGRIVGQERVIEGIENEVWAVTASDGTQLIVRITHEPGQDFGAECWAIERARRAGIPAPDVLWSEGPVSVQRRVPGLPLNKLTDTPNIDGEKVVRDLGAILAELHQIETCGFGHLDATGAGSFDTWRGYVLDSMSRFGRMAGEVATKARFEPAMVKRAIDEVQAGEELLGGAPSRLLHGDPGPAHVFVDENSAIAGLIDFGDVRGGDPVFDIAWWSVLHEPAWPVAWLIDGYAAVGDLRPRFEERMRLYRLFLAVVLGGFGAESGHDHLTDKAAAVLAEELS